MRKSSSELHKHFKLRWQLTSRALEQKCLKHNWQRVNSLHLWNHIQMNISKPLRSWKINGQRIWTGRENPNDKHVLKGSTPIAIKEMQIEQWQHISSSLQGIMKDFSNNTQSWPRCCLSANARRSTRWHTISGKPFGNQDQQPLTQKFHFWKSEA